MNLQDLNKLIDINAANSACNIEDIEYICAAAAKYSCRSVTVSPFYINSAFKCLVGRTDIIKRTQISSPLGAEMTSVKVYAAKQAEIIGAEIIEMSMNIGAFLSGNIKYVKHELETVASNLENLFSISIESALMDAEQTARAVDLAASVTPFVRIGAGFYEDAEIKEKIKLAFEASKGCVSLTAGVAGCALSDLEELKELGAEYFSLKAKEAEKLLDEAGVKLPPA